MLVISRRPREAFLLRGSDGTVTRLQVIEIGRGKVRLGIAAPDSVDIWREELGPMPGRMSHGRTARMEPVERG